MNSNSLGLLRFILAILVLLVHFHQLSGFEMFSGLYAYGCSNLSVNCFFVLSGFLMPQSFQHSKSIATFYKKRFFRIYIAYFIVVTGIASVAFFVSRCDLYTYFGADFVKYYVLNLLTLNFLKPGLDCLFQDHIITAVNGSLWSIKVEMMFYMTVPLIYYLYNNNPGLRYFRTILSLLLICLGIFTNIYTSIKYEETGSHLWLSLANQLPAKFCFFIGGWILHDLIRDDGKWLKYIFTLSILFFIGYWLQGLSYEFMQVPIASGAITFFYICKSGRCNKLFAYLGGISYPIYLLHFPITQTLITILPPHLGEYTLFGMIGISILFLACVLYYFESKILKYFKDRV